MPSYNLLDKTELKIVGIRLSGTNLNTVSDAVADILGLEPDRVLVIDVRNDEVALDILEKEVDPAAFVGKQSELLKKVSAIEGVTLLPNAEVTSHGMLAWINMGDHNSEELRSSLDQTNAIVEEARRRIAKRIIVFPTGTEVERGEIEDTNTPLLKKALTDEGYYVEVGPILKDELYLFTEELRMGVVRGFGTMITTGGVGAEDKDFSVESVLRLDPEAAIEVLVNVSMGHGRHVKDAIRIAVGEFEGARIITLPGPNDEVRACLDEVVFGIKKGLPKKLHAELIATALRKRLQEKMSVTHSKYHHDKEAMKA